MSAQEPVAATIQAQRDRLFRAMAIIEACRMGSDSMLATITGEDEPDFGDALAAAYELIDDAVDQLEPFAMKGPPPEQPEPQS